MSDDKSTATPAYVVRLVIDALVPTVEEAAELVALYKTVSTTVAAAGTPVKFKAERYDGVMLTGPVAEQVVRAAADSENTAEPKPASKPVDKNAN